MRGVASRRFGFVAVLGAVIALAGGLVASSGVSAQAPTISVGLLTSAVGLERTVDLRALDIGAPGLGAWTINVVYDPSVVSAVSCTGGQGGICNPAYAENTVRVAGVNVFGLEGDIALATITFGCVSVGTTDLTLSLGVLADATPGGPQPIDAAVANGSVTCLEEGAAPPAGPTDLPGDANCDGNDNSIDAALVLQLQASLIEALPCPQNADLNEDGAVNSIDAAIILQYAAGLLV